MSRLSDAIKDKVLKPELDRFNTNSRAVIKSYDKNKHTATIIYTNGMNGANIEVGNVLIAVGPGGIIGQNPKPGDQVLISFLNGSATPVIVEFLNEFYQNGWKSKTMHNRSGAFLPDSITGR